MPWREIFIVVFFVAAVALAAAAYFWRDKNWQPVAAVLLAAGTLFTGVALLLDDWVIVVALAAGAVTAVAVGYGGFTLGDRLKSSGPDSERLELWRQERMQHEAARKRDELAAGAARLRSESLDDRFAAVFELVALSDSDQEVRIRELLAGHVRIRARDGDHCVSPDVEAALAALARPSDYGSSARRRVNLPRVHLRGLVLTDADLQGAVLARVDLEGALLEQVNLANARLTDANLRDVTFNDVNLSGASLSGADLSGATLTRCNLHGARHDKTQWPEGFDPTAA